MRFRGSELILAACKFGFRGLKPGHEFNRAAHAGHWRPIFVLSWHTSARSSPTEPHLPFYSDEKLVA